jgi:hypothetical protein
LDGVWLGISRSFLPSDSDDQTFYVVSDDFGTSTMQATFEFAGETFGLSQPNILFHLISSKTCGTGLWH